MKSTTKIKMKQGENLTGPYLIARFDGLRFIYNGNATIALKITPTPESKTHHQREETISKPNPKGQGYNLKPFIYNGFKYRVEFKAKTSTPYYYGLPLGTRGEVIMTVRKAAI
jgi:hypothetical protein